MILFEDTRFDAATTHQRLAVLECLKKSMKLHCFSNVDALDYTCAKIVEEMKHHNAHNWPMPEGLVRVILVFTDHRAPAVVEKYLSPEHLNHGDGNYYMACPQPLAWQDLYRRIDDLRARARSYDPDFRPRYL